MDRQKPHLVNKDELKIYSLHKNVTSIFQLCYHINLEQSKNDQWRYTTLDFSTSTHQKHVQVKLITVQVDWPEDSQWYEDEYPHDRTQSN